MSETEEMAQEVALERGSFQLVTTTARIWLLRGEALGRWLRMLWLSRKPKPTMELSPRA